MFVDNVKSVGKKNTDVFIDGIYMLKKFTCFNIFIGDLQ
jgi:hypothetical protein